MDSELREHVLQMRGVLWAGLLTEVIDAVTETSSAMALAPSIPRLHFAMPMLTMLLPFMAAISSSEAAWLM